MAVATLEVGSQLHSPTISFLYTVLQDTEAGRVLGRHEASVENLTDLIMPTRLAGVPGQGDRKCLLMLHSYHLSISSVSSYFDV